MGSTDWKVEALFRGEAGMPPSHVRVDKDLVYKVRLIRDVHPCDDEENVPQGWLRVTVDGYREGVDETISVCLLVPPHSNDPMLPNWAVLAGRGTTQTIPTESMTATRIPAYSFESIGVGELITNPSWKRASCLGCLMRIVRSRDAVVTVCGTSDGSWLAHWPTDDLDMGMTGDLPEMPAYLFGVCHRACLDEAARRIRCGDVDLTQLPIVEIGDGEGDDLEYKLHLPSGLKECPFCERSDDLTDEHVWPRWLSKELRAQGAQLAGKAGPRRTQEIDITVKVCRSCNNGWMSVLENDATRILRPMLRRYETRLSLLQQKTVATWATKTAYLLDQHLGAIVPRGFPYGLNQLREPGSSVFIYLGAYEGSSAAGATFEPLILRQPNDDLLAGFVATFTAHRLAFQVLGTFTVGGADFTDRRDGLRDGLVQIWPPVSDVVTWPPKLVLPDEGLWALSKPVKTRLAR